MDEVLEAYEQRYDPAQPVICMDEQPVQLVKETREPLAATPEHARRVDYERAGTGAVFLFYEPLGNWGESTAREQSTKVDRANELAAVLDRNYADCERITLVPDDLNTHTKVAFHIAFEASRARDLVRRIEFC